MHKKTLTTILSVVLLSSFFMPFFYWHSFEMSGFNFVLSEHIPSYKYFLLAIPLTTLLHLLSVLSQEHNFYSRKLLSWIPLAALIIVFVLILANERTDDSFFSNGNILSITGAGFWLALGFSVLLTYVNFKMRSKSYYI
jgi:hypothetical protein